MPERRWKTITDRLTIIQGDALTELRKLPECSVHCCVTSPPYWGLRDYGVAGQLGLERTPEEYVAKMVEVFREVRRVLREDGTLWLNIGDSYGAGGGKQVIQTKDASYGLAGMRGCQTVGAKQLCGIPWRLAFALQADGWWLRQDIIWHKPNPMPESVTDRCTKSHEFIFLLTKSARYFFDNEAIREPQADYERGRDGEIVGTSIRDKGDPMVRSGSLNNMDRNGAKRLYNPAGRNKRSVWTVATDPYSEAHFATFPPDLIKPCILAGTSAKGCCPKCGAPWERRVESTPMVIDRSDRSPYNHHSTRSSGTMVEPAKSTTIGWQPTCDCFLSPENVTTVPCTVLDPFGGSGTTGMVALELGRKAILIELNPAYVKLAERRCDVTPGLALA